MLRSVRKSAADSELRALACARAPLPLKFVAYRDEMALELTLQDNWLKNEDASKV